MRMLYDLLMCWELILNINKRDLVFINQLAEFKVYGHVCMTGIQFRRLCFMHEKYIYRMKLHTSYVRRMKAEEIEERMKIIAIENQLEKEKKREERKANREKAKKGRKKQAKIRAKNKRKRTVKTG